MIQLFKIISILKGWLSKIFLAGQHFHGVNGPLDIQVWVIPLNTRLCLWHIRIIHLIYKYSLITQHKKTMSKSTRNEKLTMVFVTQFHGHMTTKSWTTLPHIYSNIQYPPFYNAY